MNTQAEVDYVGPAVEQIRLLRSLQPAAGLPPRILIIDDAPQDIELLRHRFEKLGCRVDSCRNGDDAMRVVEDSIPFRIALVDQIFPTERGTEIVERLRNIFPGMLIAIITGQLTNDLMVQAAKLHCAVFPKDMLTDELMREFIK